ncbi:MAG: hypothetical protein HZB56_07880 [Deltaproteobacteria bacterium]|nr:hypothetical protein [Deltaproteobacteria bacterium]
MGGPGSGGHNRKSDAAKRLAGTYRASRARPTASALPGLPVVAVPPPPAGLPAWEAEEWETLAAEVDDAGTFTAADLGAFQALHRAVVMLRCGLRRVKGRAAFDFRELVAARRLVEQLRGDLLLPGPMERLARRLAQEPAPGTEAPGDPLAGFGPAKKLH